MEQAEGVLEMTKTKGYTPGSVAYSALLCAYAQHEDLDGMLKVLSLVWLYHSGREFLNINCF